MYTLEQLRVGMLIKPKGMYINTVEGYQLLPIHRFKIHSLEIDEGLLEVRHISASGGGRGLYKIPLKLIEPLEPVNLTMVEILDLFLAKHRCKTLFYKNLKKFGLGTRLFKITSSDGFINSAFGWGLCEIRGSRFWEELDYKWQQLLDRIEESKGN